MKRKTFDSLWKKLRLTKNMSITTRENFYQKCQFHLPIYLETLIKNKDQLPESPTFIELDTLYFDIKNTLKKRMQNQICELKCNNGILEAQDAMIFVRKFSCVCHLGDDKTFPKWTNNHKYTLLRRHSNELRTNEPDRNDHSKTSQDVGVVHPF